MRPGCFVRQSGRIISFTSLLRLMGNADDYLCEITPKTAVSTWRWHDILRGRRSCPLLSIYLHRSFIDRKVVGRVKMRAIVQRVDSASIFVDSRHISSVEKGALIFLGIERGDDSKDADYLLDKVINLRIFEDEMGKMNHSLLDKSYGMLVVSQFTLLGDCRKGRRPSFVSAEHPEKAKLLYEYFISKGRESIKNVSGGEFQAMMKVQLINHGPVTILLDSRKPVDERN